ncbi:PilN domain-containing protein [Hafnia alvei]|uniref:PilN domain-containing protein n=1 Tax=Hafnia alvei TaxID=569 RepID=UPI001F301648|nr:PilN domain-containing protein [Hafnia alvei]MCE9870805.1 PilN domain-containing protein [Hafnia alvei]
MEQINLCPWFSTLRAQRLRLCMLCLATVVVLLILIASYSAYQVHRRVQRWEAVTAVSQRRSQQLLHQQVRLAAWALQAKNQLRQSQQDERNRETNQQILTFILAIQRHIPAQVWLTRLSWRSTRLEIEGTTSTPAAISDFIQHLNQSAALPELQLMKMSVAESGLQKFLLEGGQHE